MFTDKKKEEGVKQQKISEIKDQFAEFIKTTARLALEEVSEELKKYERVAEVFDNGFDYVSITVKKKDKQGFMEEEFQYAIKLPRDAQRAHPIPEIHFRDKDRQFYRTEGFIRSGGQDYTVKDITKEEIVNHFVNEYKLHISF